MKPKFSAPVALALALAGTACMADPAEDDQVTERTAVRVETEDTGAAFPSLAMNAEGDAVLVWTHFDGLSLQFWANNYSTADGWGTAQPIEGASGNATSSGADIAIDAAGDAIAVWDLSTGEGLHEIMATRYHPTTGWSAAQRISADASSDAYEPQVEFDAEGDAVVVWSVPAAPSAVWANRYDLNAGWGTAQAIASHPQGNASTPSLATSRNGDTTLAYVANEGDTSSVLSMRHNPSSGWSQASVVAAADNVLAGYGGAHSYPRIGMADNGDAIAVWMSSGHPLGSINAAKCRPDGDWEATEVPLVGSGSVTPELSVSGSGETFVVWRADSHVTGFNSVFAGHYSPTSGWSATEVLATVEHAQPNRATIASNDAVDAVAVWYQSEGDQSEVWSKRYDPVAGWKPVRHIASSHPKSCSACLGSLDPQVAMDEAGNALVVWLQYEGSRLDLWALELPKE